MYSKRKLVAGFSRWIEMRNYVQYSLENDPKILAIFLEWMMENEAQSISQITGKKVRLFFEQLSKQKTQRTGEVLSLSMQRKYLTTINRFAKYLRESGQGNIEVPIQFKGQSERRTVVLSKLEIDQLYEVCDGSLLGLRDRAILAVFYGCGVRRNEGASLEVKDVLPDKNLLYIRQAKGGNQRYVPMVGQVKRDIISYLETTRPMLMNKQLHEMFFIGITGKPFSGSGLYERIRKLAKQVGIEKKIGLHTLRHSIATHLLASGMKLSEIAKFLGHSSLESTQIYTHIVDEI